MEFFTFDESILVQMLFALAIMAFFTNYIINYSKVSLS